MPDEKGYVESPHNDQLNANFTTTAQFGSTLQCIKYLLDDYCLPKDLMVLS